MSTTLRPATNYPAIVSRILQREREERGVSQGFIAEKLGVSQGSWSRIESGSSAVSLDQLHRVSGEFNKTPAEILRDADRVEGMLRSQGVEIVPVRSSVPGAAMMTGAALGALLALMVLKKGS